MSLDRFDIYFSGATLPDFAVEQVRDALQRLFRADERQIERLFSGTPVRIKRDVDADTAGRYRATLRSVGALVDVKPRSGSPPPPATSPAQSELPTTSGMEVAETSPYELLPPRTGSLEDCAPPPAPAPRVNIDGIRLAALGEVLDQTPPAPRADIRTEHLSAAAPNSGSLEDCAQPASPRPVPEVSHLRLVDGD